MWDRLVSAAVVGTDRRPFPGLAEGGPLAALAGTDLATAAAAVWAYERTGRVPGTGGPPLRSEAESDRRPPLGEGPVRALAAILGDGRYRPLLGEWLELAERLGRRLPAELLPSLLDAAAPGERGAVAAVSGSVGAWLAGHNPDWAWVTDQPAPAPAPARVFPPAGEAELLHSLGRAPLAEHLAVVGGASCSPAVTEAVLEALGQTISAGDPGRAILVRDALPVLARRLDPDRGRAVDAVGRAFEAVPEAQRPAAHAVWDRALALFVATIHFRHAMHREMQ